MSEYFDFSQGVRKEIESDTVIMEKLKKHFGNSQCLEEICSGDHNNIYRVGVLKSGIWVALRQRYEAEYSELLKKSGFSLKCYEIYAKKAEDYASKGIRVPSFCIGVMQGDNAGLLVEDLTKGGRQKIINDINPEYGYIVNNPEKMNIFRALFNDLFFVEQPKEKAYFDLDNWPFDEVGNLYMAKDYRISL